MSNTFQIEHLSFTTATVPASEYIKLAVLDHGQITTPYLLTYIPSQQLWFTKHDLNDPASESDLDNKLQGLRSHLLRLGIDDTVKASRVIQENSPRLPNSVWPNSHQDGWRFSECLTHL